MAKLEYDFNNFDPEANDFNNYNPPEGDYQIKVVSAEAIKQGIVLEFLTKAITKLIPCYIKRTTIMQIHVNMLQMI